MAALPNPPTPEEIEEDLASAPHTDPVFSFPLGEVSGGAQDDEVAAVAEQAVQFVLAYDQLKEDGALSLPTILTALEQNMAELRTVIRAPPK